MKYRRSRIFLLIMSFVLLAAALCRTAPAGADPRLERMRDYYKPESWPRTDAFLVPGLRLDGLVFEGFRLAGKRYCSPGRGTNYIWRFDKEGLEVWTIVQACASVEKAQEELLGWLTAGISVQLRRGSLVEAGERVGDISWADPQYNTLAFVRSNIMVIVLGRTTGSRLRPLINNLARTIDESITKGPKVTDLKGGLTAYLPVIERLSLSNGKPKLNQQVRLTVTGHDPRGLELKYVYRASSGAITETAKGVYYRAAAPGRQTLTVIAVSADNFVTEKKIEVEVGR